MAPTAPAKSLLHQYINGPEPTYLGKYVHWAARLSHATPFICMGLQKNEDVDISILPYLQYLPT